MKDLAKNLLALRREAGKTQKEVADALGIVPSALSAYENGQRVPSLDFAVSLAAYYGVSLDTLCGIQTRQREGKAKPFSRADVFRIVTALCENTDATIEVEEFEETMSESACTQIIFGLPGNQWLKPFCDKFDVLFKLYKNGDIDYDVLEAWKEKQFANNENLPAEEIAPVEGTFVETPPTRR